MRISRGDVIAGLDAPELREYFRSYGDGAAVISAMAMEEFSVTKRKADELIAELVRLELIRRSEFQPEKDVIRYETTIQGNALALAKAGKPVSRAFADRVLEEFLGRGARSQKERGVPTRDRKAAYKHEEALRGRRNMKALASRVRLPKTRRRRVQVSKIEAPNLGGLREQ